MTQCQSQDFFAFFVFSFVIKAAAHSEAVHPDILRRHQSFNVDYTSFTAAVSA